MKKRLYYCLFVAVFTILNVFVSHAINIDIALSDLTDEEITAFLSSVDFKTEKDEPKKDFAVCFDVNTDGLVAVGMDGLDNQNISVYDVDGNFKYAYSFDCTGKYYVKWDDGNLLVYFVRSDIIASLDSDGNCVEIKSVADSDENDRYIRKVFCANEKTVDDKSYRMRNPGVADLFSWSYSQIQETGADKSVRTVYHADNQSIIRVGIEIAAAAVFLAVAVGGLFKRLRKRRI